MVEARPEEVSPAEVRPGEVCPAEVRLHEVRVGEVRRAEVRPAEVRVANVGVLAPPIIPRGYALLEQGNVLVVCHGSTLRLGFSPSLPPPPASPLAHS